MLKITRIVITMIFTSVTGGSSIIRGQLRETLVTMLRHSKSRCSECQRRARLLYRRAIRFLRGASSGNFRSLFWNSGSAGIRACIGSVVLLMILGGSMQARMPALPLVTFLMRSRSNATNLLLRWLGATVLMALAVCAAQAREMTMRVRLSVSANSTRLKVEGFYRQGSKSWRFVNSSGRLLGLGSRIQNLKILSEGKDLFIRKLAPGEFASDENAAEFNYEVDLTPPQARDDAAHISWLDGQQGYLMLGDLLPDSAAGPIEVELELPPHWLAQSSSKSKTQWKYEHDDKANAIFFVGAALKEKQEKVGSTEITFVASGEWAFSRDAAVGRAARIVK